MPDLVKIFLKHANAKSAGNAMSDQARLAIDEYSAESTAADVERQRVLRASAMIDLADEIESRVNHDLPSTATCAIRLTVQEWEMIDSALRAAAG